MRAYEFLPEARKAKEYEQRDIDDVKYAYDQGSTYDEIARLIGLPFNDVSNILTQYYPERKRRAEHLKSALTDADKEKIVYSFMDGKEINVIADDIGIAPSLARLVLRDALGQEEVDQELNRRRTMPGTRIRNKVTPEMLEIIRSQYVDGKSPVDISIALNGVVGPTAVYHTLRKQPDWSDLRLKWEQRRKAVRHRGPAMKKVTRPGTPTGFGSNLGGGGGSSSGSRRYRRFSSKE